MKAIFPIQSLKLAVFLLLCLLAVAFRLGGDELFFKVPKGWPKPAYDFKNNPLHADKIALGRQLFYDPILSLDSTISCASCHSPYSAFTHIDHDLSHGIYGRIGKRNAPALMNLAWHKQFMWDGAINHLDMQALAPITHHDEMAENMPHVVDKLQRTSLYPNLFYRAFADSIITGQHVLKAIAQFSFTLVSADSKYDKVMRKEAQFSVQEQNGYQLFKRHCATCHTEPLFTNLQFANNGLSVDPTLRDVGRMKISLKSDDSLKFKVPTLRNIEYSYPYMHDGRFRKLSEVLNHYAIGLQKSNTLAPQLRKNIVLSPNEKVDLIAFLLTLSDKDFIFNKNIGPPTNK